MNLSPALTGSEPWRIVAEAGGVVLRTRGDGTPVFVFPGMEGSGESCLDLVLPVMAARPSHRDPVRPVLVDFAAEQSDSLDTLVTTIGRLVQAHRGTNEDCDVWGQSFGNALLGSVVNRFHFSLTRLVMVSAFQQLPRWKTLVEPPVVTVTPEPLYRATLTPLARWQFGPDGGNLQHPFFTSLRRMPKANVARRTAWLRGRRFTDDFLRLAPQRGKVWLGSRDRLVDLRAERDFFAHGVDRHRLEYGEIRGSGHVVLPRAVIQQARRQLSDWFWAEP